MRRCEPGRSPGAGATGAGDGGGRGGRILTREAGKTARRRAVPILPTGLTFPDTLMVPGSAPGGSGGALGSLSRRGSTPRGARQASGPMSVSSRGAGAAGSDSRLACSGMGAPSSQLCRLLLGTLVAESGSSDQEMPGDDSNDDNNKRS